jgi:hypothetical protein
MKDEGSREKAREGRELNLKTDIDCKQPEKLQVPVTGRVLDRCNTSRHCQELRILTSKARKL